MPDILTHFLTNNNKIKSLAYTVNTRMQVNIPSTFEFLDAAPYLKSLTYREIGLITGSMLHLNQKIMLYNYEEITLHNVGTYGPMPPNTFINFFSDLVDAILVKDTVKRLILRYTVHYSRMI